MKYWITYKRPSGKESGCYREAANILDAMGKFENDHPAWEIISAAEQRMQADALPCGHQFANLRTDAVEPYCNFCGKPVRR